MPLERVHGAVKALARWSAYGGAAALLACVAVTVVDVTMRNFLQSSVFGSVEIVQLGIMWAAFLTIPLGFARGDHIAVDVFVAQARTSVRDGLRAVHMLFTALAMAACLWWGGAQALHSLLMHEVTLTAGLPMWLYWVPILYGTALSVAAALINALQAASRLKPRHAARVRP